MKKKIDKFDLLVIISIVILCICFTIRTFQNDTFYTIKIGNLILKNGIDMLDHFSWHSLAYTYPHWLYDVMISVIYNIGSWTGLYISTIIFYSILLISFYLTCIKLTKNKVISLFMIIMVLLGINAFATARAQLITYILFVLEFNFIETFLKNGKKRYLIYLFIISLLICNMHCAVWIFYFILFLPFIFEYIITLIGKNKKIKKSKLIKLISKKITIEENKNYKYLLIVMLVSLLTGFMTPIGDTPFTYIFKMMMGNAQSYVEEHMMISIWKNPLVLSVLAELLIIFTLTKTKIKLRDLCMLVGLVFMAILSPRHIALLVCIGFICITRLLSNFMIDIEENFTPKITKTLSRPLGFTIFLIAIIGVGQFIFRINLSKPYLDETLYPLDAVEYIKENIDLDDARIYNDYNFGSYLLLNDIPVYLDSRADLYTKQFSGLDYDIFDDYMNLSGGYHRYFSFYEITHVITYKNEWLGQTLENDIKFEKLYEDDYFVIYKRDTTPDYSFVF